MWGIIIAIVLTFTITAAWQHFSTKRNRKLLQSIIWAMIGDMDEMARKIGYQDYVTYINNTKPDEAEIILANLNGALKSLSDKG